jgi:hypothetical protein
MDSLKREIARKAWREYPRWIHGGEFERMGMQMGFLGSNASRRCRELVKAGTFERRIGAGRTVEYRYHPIDPQDEEKAMQERLLRAVL